jgi:putative membrane protein insertion efficiency factor
MVKIKHETFAVKIILLLLQIYRCAINPMTKPCCRFYPTCSTYAQEAIEKYGFWRGNWLILKRLARCHPLSKGGFDPVP